METEFQAWLLWYSSLVLMDILSNPYYTHYCYLVGAMSILLGNNIIGENPNKADNLLNSFCRRFADLYGKL